MAHENGDAHLTDMAEQVMGNEQITSLEELNKLIDAVTAADVSTVSTCILNLCFTVIRLNGSYGQYSIF